MTRDEILNMPAGREMDVTVGYHVMDLVAPPEIYPEYSTDIAAAWGVIERLMKLDSHWSPGVNWDDGDGDGNPMWIASFTYYGEDESQFQQNEVWNKSAPLAICHAALLAVMPL
jgi:hypothetical protein